MELHVTDPKSIDILWILVTGGLVFLMQAGFMCLECGLTRAKNSINVAIKNLTDFVIAYVLFWAAGYAVMFGVTWDGWIGTTDFLFPFETRGDWLSAFFFFQAMFCATAATILSGAIAERIHYFAYCVLTVYVSMLIYPVFGHWAWNGADGISSGGWLVKMGFVDFAGSSVVHSVGGWVSLAALLIIGARTGRFPADGGPPRKITGNSLPLSVLGCILLYLGWFGFNGGSTLAMNGNEARIIANTALAGATGSCAMLFFGWAIRKRPDVELVINGALAGLVAITANCHAVTAANAALIGVIGGLVALALEALLEKLRIDDAVGAVPVHLGAGVWGTLAVGIFGDPEILGKGMTNAEQTVVQLTGIAVCGAWSFGVAFVLLWITNKLFPLRVSLEQEERGLNVSEHGASTELIDLMTVMERQGRTADLSLRVPVEPFTEVGQIARRYNEVMGMLENAVARAEGIVRDIQDGIITWAKNGAVTSLNPGAEKIFGYSMSDLLGQPASLLFAAPNGAPLPAELLAAEVETDSAWVGMRRDATRFPVEVRVSEGTNRGEPVYTALVKDITQRKVAEDALERSRDLAARHSHALAALAAKQSHFGSTLGVSLERVLTIATETLEGSGGSLWSFEERYARLRRVCTVSYVPVSADEEFAMDAAEELIDTFWHHRTQGFSDAARHRSFGPFHAAVYAGRGVTSVLAAQVRLGGELWGMLFLEHRGDPKSWSLEEEQFVGSAADFISLRLEDDRRRRAEAQVRQMNADLEGRVQKRTQELQASYRELQDAMNELKDTQTQLVQSEKMAALGELVAGIAHEINTPIGISVTAASNYEQKTRDFLRKLADNQLKRSDLDGYARLSEETARMLMVNLERAAELVQSFKKVAVDQSSEARRVFNLGRYTEEVLLSLRPRIKKSKLQVELNCPADIELNSYPGAYSQIITNLIVNSMMHAYEPEQEGTIRLSFTLDNGDVIFDYVDDGKGIEGAVLGRIFDPFFTTKRGSGGSGLGLHILYNIISGTLGGSVEVFSKVGEGTHFRLRMPLNPGESARGD
jgi:ammonium transporter